VFAVVLVTLFAFRLVLLIPLRIEILLDRMWDVEPEWWLGMFMSSARQAASRAERSAGSRGVSRQT
jgi:hypothetical protein